MTDPLQQISLLYELSVTTLKHLDPAETANSFVKKFLSRKNLSFGAVWIFEHQTEDCIRCKNLFSIPKTEQTATISIADFSKLFGNDTMAFSKHSIIHENVSKGSYAYCKLGEIGLLELHSKSESQELDKQALYPFKDVINQLAVSLKSGFSYQNLQREIQQRMDAEKSLKTNEEKYRRIVNNIELGLLEVDNNDIIQNANQSFCNLTGYTLEELKGQNASDLLLSPEDRRQMAINNAERKSGHSGIYELPIFTKSGEKKWTVISGAANFDKHGDQIGSIGIHLDITKQKELSQQYAFQESKLRKLFEVSLDALISIDNRGKIIEWNPQAEKIFGYEKQEVLGKQLSETIIPHAFKKAHEEGMKNFHATGEGPVLNKRIEITAIRKGGEEFAIELTIFPIEHDETHYFTAFVRDITELKESREAMQEALKQQTELNNLKSQFVSMTSHELRTPLTTISTDIELLNFHVDQPNEVRKDKLKSILSRIDTNVERLNHLINNILLIGQLDTKKVPFNPSACDIQELIKAKVLPNYSMKERALKLVVKGKPYEISIDPKLFIHVIDNLISNAYKYSEGRKPPELFIDYQDTDVLIHVTDHGIGIPEQEQPKLFSTFFRASNVGNVQGSGLGLSIVNEFVKLHKGLITFKSKVNEGTTFTVIFPKN